RQPSPLLHRAMVLLHHIVEVFALPQTNPTREDVLSVQPFHSRRKGPVLVHIDDPWHRIAGRTQRLTEEAPGRSRIPPGGEQKTRSSDQSNPLPGTDICPRL